MTSGRMTDTKVCRSCGRVMTWRKAWARTWEEMRCCSAGCRRRGVSPTDRSLEEAILILLAQRSRGATIRPSEAARAVAGPEAVMLKGRPVGPSTAKGEVQVRLAERGGAG